MTVLYVLIDSALSLNSSGGTFGHQVRHSATLECVCKDPDAKMVVVEDEVVCKPPCDMSYGLVRQSHK